MALPVVRVARSKGTSEAALACNQPHRSPRIDDNEPIVESVSTAAEMAVVVVTLKV